jgi:hypothetical protein
MSTVYAAELRKSVPIFTGFYEVSNIRGSVADPDPGPLPFWPSVSGIEKNLVQGFGMKISYHISGSLVTLFWVKHIKIV